jgi:hypothetical protein
MCFPRCSWIDGEAGWCGEQPGKPSSTTVMMWTNECGEETPRRRRPPTSRRRWRRSLGTGFYIDYRNMSPKGRLWNTAGLRETRA